MAENKKYYAGHRVHGVHIPPRKHPYKGRKSVTLEFVLTGTVPSKKNLQIPTFNRSHTYKQLNDYFFAVAPFKTPVDNLKFVRRVVKEIKCYIRNSDKFNKWQEKMKPVLTSQAQVMADRYKKHGLQYPITECSIFVMYYWADDRIRDNSNKSETIHDILVAAGIILDDNYACLYKNSAEAECHKGDILKSISHIFVTAYSW